MGHSDARDSRPADVIVGDQEGICHLAQDADLVAHVGQIGSGCRLNLADDLKASLRHDETIGQPESDHPDRRNCAMRMVASRRISPTIWIWYLGSLTESLLSTHVGHEAQCRHEGSLLLPNSLVGKMTVYART